MGLRYGQGQPMHYKLRLGIKLGSSLNYSCIDKETDFNTRSLQEEEKHQHSHCCTMFYNMKRFKFHLFLHLSVADVYLVENVLVQFRKPQKFLSALQKVE